MTALDSLKYIARKNESLIAWVHSVLEEGDFGRDNPVNNHYVLEADEGLAKIDTLVQAELERWAAGENGPDHYSDGRPIVTEHEAEPGVVLRYIHHPDPDAPLDPPYDVDLPSGRIATISAFPGQRVEIALNGWWRTPDGA